MTLLAVKKGLARVVWRYNDSGRLRTGVKSRTWELLLACGHTVYRGVRRRRVEYRRENVPAPKRVACDKCAR